MAKTNTSKIYVSKQRAIKKFIKEYKTPCSMVRRGRSFQTVIAFKNATL